MLKYFYVKLYSVLYYCICEQNQTDTHASLFKEMLNNCTWVYWCTVKYLAAFIQDWDYIESLFGTRTVFLMAIYIFYIDLSCTFWYNMNDIQPLSLWGIYNLSIEYEQSHHFVVWSSLVTISIQAAEHFWLQFLPTTTDIYKFQTWSESVLFEVLLNLDIWCVKK